MIKNKKLLFIFFLIITFIINMSVCFAEEFVGRITENEVRVRKGPGTNYEIIRDLVKGNDYNLVSKELYSSEKNCSNGWYKLYYEEKNEGYVCSDYVYLLDQEILNIISSDEYERPWVSPKKAIIGGAKYIGKFYIQKGQFTSYLKKFNVNPNGSYSVYNHQYMANLAAPYSEAYTSFKSYRDNGLLSLPLEFTIPVFLNMPDYTKLPGKEIDTSCENNVIDTEFEEKLNEQNFPESYRCKLRNIHKLYPNWTFKAMHTNLDFNRSVTAEKAVSSIQGDIYCDKSSGKKIQTESGWYIANNETVAYYLDPRNFLISERILMFENLSYSTNYNETTINSILKGTFMEDISILDNQTYASIFIEAGQKAQISSVYLASLARQESGSKGGRATTGAQFTYKGITYKGLFNFYNIGANSSAESPVYAGLVWAAGGNDAVVVKPVETPTPEVPQPTTPEVPSEPQTPSVPEPSPVITLSESEILSKLGFNKKDNIITNLSIGMTYGELKKKSNDVTITMNGKKDSDVLKTGDSILIAQATNKYNYVIAIKGDVDGDGEVAATDYVRIKNYIVSRGTKKMSEAALVAADYDNDNDIGATDYVRIKNDIIRRIV